MTRLGMSLLIELPENPGEANVSESPFCGVPNGVQLSGALHNALSLPRQIRVVAVAGHAKPTNNATVSRAERLPTWRELSLHFIGQISFRSLAQAVEARRAAEGIGHDVVRGADGRRGRD